MLRRLQSCTGQDKYGVAQVVSAEEDAAEGAASRRSAAASVHHPNDPIHPNTLGWYLVRFW